MVEAQAIESTDIADVSGSVVSKWPPHQAPNCDTREPIPCCRKPIAPEAVPAASGRTLMAPAAEFAITKALATITIIWVPNSTDGVWLVPVRLNTRLSALPNSCNANPNQISFSSEWRGAKRTQNTLPIRYANAVVANQAPYSALERPICVTTM